MQQQINLYLDLVEGEFADLEVVAKASLAFAAAVREISYIIDPSLTVKLELESGTEGSLSLNSIIHFIRGQVADPVTRKIIVLGILAWFAQETGSALLGIVVNDLVSDDPSISEEDALRIAEKVQLILEKKVGAKPIQDVFKELEKDKSITGVGVSTKKGARPKAIVPRSEFHRRSGSDGDEIDAKETRTRPERMVLTLISPVLQNNHNKWRFLSKDGNIYAAIKDEKFLSDMLSGKAGIPMKSGIIILANVEIKEKRSDNAWEITERNIIEVVDVRTSDNIDDLFSQK